VIRRLLVLLLAFSLCSGASAQALPSRIGAEVLAVIKAKVGARGFAANDPRFSGTMLAASTAVVEIATAVVVAGTAPAWGSVLASVAIAGAVGYGIQALTNWIFNGDGTVTHTPTSTPVVIDPDASWIWFGDGSQGWPIDSSGGSMGFCTAYFKGDTIHTVASSSGFACNITSQFAGQGGAYPFGSLGWVRRVADPNYQPAGSGSTTPVTEPAAVALQALSDAEKAKPLPNKVIADIADAAFRKAASDPGYSGVPYSMSDPITEADVSAFVQANPSFAVATVGDLAQSVSTTDPLGAAGSSPSTGTPTNPAASAPLVNLGSDPGIGSPSLEATPTGAQILQPLTTLMPDLKNFQVPAHQAVCPKPSFNLFGKNVVMDGQCTLFEGIRGELYNAMVVAFLLVALFIVLSA
jgi:hypothetical protein